MASSYEDLKVWQKAMDFTATVYRCTRSFPADYFFVPQASELRKQLPVIGRMLSTFMSSRKASA